MLKKSMTPNNWTEDELRRGIEAAERFEQYFNSPPTVIVRSPGRAEILGNHTDYNQGLALAAAISRSIIACTRKRADKQVRLRTAAFPKEITLDIDNLQPAESVDWSSYSAGVLAELKTRGVLTTGLDLFLTSNLPLSGGLSSSAAYELAILNAVCGINGITIDPVLMTTIAKAAENGPFVRTPCGFLDQATVALNKRDTFLFLDFRATGDQPFQFDRFPARMGAAGMRLVIALDPEVKRNLGQTGYLDRKRSCDESLPIIGELLRRPISSLRDARLEEIQSISSDIKSRGGATMLNRVVHVVSESDRVIRSRQMLAADDWNSFGELLNESGHSGLELFELNQGTPELTFLVEQQRAIAGVKGVRNMGGGFSAISLALVEEAMLDAYRVELTNRYREKWSRKLELIDFQSEDGASWFTL